MKVLYRYEINYTNADDGDTSVFLKEIPIIRETEKTYFINRFYWGGSEKKVKKDAHNTYAYDTKEKAKAHFIRRTNKRLTWYRYWTEECQKALKLIEKIGAE